MKEASLDHLMQSLGWTLLHSLWQTALVALCLYVLLAFSQKLGPNVKYVMGVVALLFTGALAGTTFLDLYFHHQPALEELQKDVYLREITASSIVLTNEQPALVVQQSIDGFFMEKIQDLKNVINLHLYWIVAVWMTGVLLLSLRFAGSLFYIHRLKKRSVSMLAARYQLKMQKMAALLQLSQPVKLLASGVAQVPMMLGHLKPVILIPASMVSGLPEDQLEAIIAHEMAHIYRKDYWINIIQSFFEIIFFFHPAIWWISAVIREEREKCCDDLAVALCGDSLTYAKALASVEEVKLQYGQMALAINGGKRSLLQRIERILQPDKKSGGNQTARFVSASLVMICLLLLGSTGDSIAYKYSGQKANEALTWIKTIYLEGKIENVDALDAESDAQNPVTPERLTTEHRRKSSGNAHTMDTVPASPVVAPQTMHPIRSYPDSLLSKTIISAPGMVFNMPTLATTIPPGAMYFHGPDTIPGMHGGISALLDSLAGFHFSFGMDSTFIFNHQESNGPHVSHNFHFDSLAFDPGAFAFSFDSTFDFRVLHNSLMPALALADSSLRNLHTYANAYQFHVQDTSIERRLRELETSMREKEMAFEKLMLEKEALIQELMREKELEMRAHENTFEQQMHEQESKLEEQMRQQEEQMMRQEEIMERQLEEMENQAKKMELQEENLRKAENRFDQAHAALEEELVKDGLIQQGETYTFKLSSEGLFINNQKQADKVYTKYLKWMQESETFRFEEGSTLNITRKAK